MADVSKTIQVAASEDAVMTALVKCVADVKAAIKAGGGTLPEVTAIGAALVADLVPALSQVTNLESDASADPLAAERAVACQLPDLVAAIRS
jgi:hypothetical protein